jgi:hypothetical protein
MRALESVQLRCLDNINDHVEAPTRLTVTRSVVDGMMVPGRPLALNGLGLSTLRSSCGLYLAYRPWPIGGLHHAQQDPHRIDCRPVVQIGGTISHDQH